MNPRSIELGMVYGVPILVASSFEDIPGTLIQEEADMNIRVGEIRNRVRGIATEKDVVKITVYSVVDRPGVAASIFEPLAESEISVDIIVQNASVSGTTDLTFTINAVDLDNAMEVVRKAAKDLGTENVASASGFAKVSIVGTGMQDAPGYASRMFGALSEGGINIEMITTSEIRITCIISEDKIGDAARLLHEVFEMENPE